MPTRERSVSLVKCLRGPPDGEKAARWQSTFQQCAKRVFDRHIAARTAEFERVEEAAIAYRKSMRAHRCGADCGPGGRDGNPCLAPLPGRAPMGACATRQAADQLRPAHLCPSPLGGEATALNEVLGSLRANCRIVLLRSHPCDTAYEIDSSLTPATSAVRRCARRASAKPRGGLAPGRGRVPPRPGPRRRPRRPSAARQPAGRTPCGPASSSPAAGTTAYEASYS